MDNTRRRPLWVFFPVLALAGFLVLFCLSLAAPSPSQPDLPLQLSQVAPALSDGAQEETLYQQPLSQPQWSQPACAIIAARSPYTVYLDGTLLASYTPGPFEHGRLVHWVLLPDTDLSGQLLTVCAPSQDLTVLVGEYSDLLLHFRNANVPTLFFSGLFLFLGSLIWLLSLGAKAAIGGQRLRTLRYLSALVLLVSLWISMDGAVFQFAGLSGAVMYVLAMYAFMAMPLFMLQFYRSMMAPDSRGLRLLCRLHVLNLCLCGLLQALGIAPLHKTLHLTHALMIATLLALLGQLVRWLGSAFRRQAQVMLGGFAALGYCCAAAFLDYYLGGQQLYLILFSAGILLYVASLLAVSMGYLYQEMVKSSQMRYYQKMANTDLMTQLASRTAFEERVRLSPTLAGPCACIVMDINGLKQVNDTLGHSAGDQLIRSAAENILSVFEPLGTCYRMGGDEFAVLLENTTAAQVRKALSQLDLSISRSNLTQSVPLSLAVGHATGQDAPIQALFHDADTAMYRNKNQMKRRAAAPS